MEMRRQYIRDIEYLFLEQLDPIAAKYYHRGWTYPSEGLEEESHNKAVVSTAQRITEYVKEGKIHPIDGLALLYQYQPTTQKTKPKNFPEHYTLAVKAWEEARTEIISKLDWEIVQLLNTELQRAWKRTRVPGEDCLEIADNIKLERKNKEDKWFLVYNNKTSPYYVKLGNLGTGNLQGNIRVDYSEHGTRISILIKHKRGPTPCYTPSCKLPIATEITILPGGSLRFHPWRLNTSDYQAMLPLEGTLVRIGDVTLKATETPTTWAPSQFKATLPTPSIELELNREYMYYTVPAHITSVTFTHPDHLPVTVTRPPYSSGWYIEVREVDGYTYTTPE